MSEIDEIPKGWIVEKLVNVCDEISAGGDVPKNNFSLNKTVDFQIPIFANGEKNKGLYGFTDIPKIAIPSVTISARGSIGFSEFRNAPFFPIVRLIVLCPTKNLDALFLKYAVDNCKIIHTGTTIPQLTVPTVKDLQIPIPPLSEQHRIVAKIEELFSSLDKGIESLKTAQAQLKVYRQAVLKWAFEGKLTNNKDVKFFTLGEFCNGVEYGSAIKSKEIGKIPVLRMGNIQGGRFDWHDLVYTNDDHEIEKYLLKINDVLFNRTNSPEWVGKTALYKGERPAIFAGYLIRINYKKDKINPNYLNYYMNSQEAKNYGSKVKSFGVNQSNINGTKLKTYPFPYTTLVEQEKIIQEIESRLSVCDKIEESITTSLLQAEALRQSILKKAFEGKLVPQDPNDEPAEKLLKRIKADRMQNQPVKKVKDKKVKSKNLN